MGGSMEPRGQLTPAQLEEEPEGGPSRFMGAQDVA